MMGWANHGYGMWGMGWFGSIMMLAFWVAIIAGIFLVVRSFTTGHSATPSSKGSDAIEILRERFAKGEIDKQEYEEKMNILSALILRKEGGATTL